MHVCNPISFDSASTNHTDPTISFHSSSTSDPRPRIATASTTTNTSYKPYNSKQVVNDKIQSYNIEQLMSNGRGKETPKTLPRDFSPGEPQRQNFSTTGYKFKSRLPISMNIPINMEELAGIGNFPKLKHDKFHGATFGAGVSLPPGVLLNNDSSDNFEQKKVKKGVKKKAVKKKEESLGNIKANGIFNNIQDMALSASDIEQGTLRSKVNDKKIPKSLPRFKFTDDSIKAMENTRTVSQKPIFRQKVESFLKPRYFGMPDSAPSDSEISSSQLSTQLTSSLMENTGSSKINSSKSGTHSSTSLGTSTSYITAKTSQSVPDSSSKTTPLDSNTSHEAGSKTSSSYFPFIEEANIEEDNDSVFDLDSPEKLFNELDHKPPFLPSLQSYNGFGKPSLSLRQTVIQRQSSRISPTSDRLIEHMEERLARWNGPQSSSSAADAINGLHPYQRPEIPILEPQNLAGFNNSILRESSIAEGTATNTSIESILRSGFVSNQPKLNIPQRQVTFREEVQESNNHMRAQILSPQSNTSIQDSAEFTFEDTEESSRHQSVPQQNSDSASVSSSIMDRINNISHPSSQSRAIDGSDLDVRSVIAERTPEAIPLNSGDLRNLFKGEDGPFQTRFHDNPFILQRVEPEPISGFSAYGPGPVLEEDEGFWSQLGDCCMITFTCGCLDNQSVVDWE